jgi:hypothetical protein
VAGVMSSFAFQLGLALAGVAAGIAGGFAG